MLPLLPLILIIPLIGSLILLIIDRKDLVNGDPSLLKNNEIRLKQVALTTSLINFFVSLFIWFNFDSNISQYQFVLEFNQLGLFDLNFGIDAISLYFVLLTTFITPIALLSNYSNILGKEAENIKFFLISILLLESLQICAFVSLDLLLFYIFFESAKICGLYLSCLQLSKSENSLKLLVPYYKQLNIYILFSKNDIIYIFIFNFILGSTYIILINNNRFVVIIQKIYENKMGYPGTNSILIVKQFNSAIDKAQRVNDSYFENLSLSKLSCTLMGCENNYQISSLSKPKQFITQYRKIKIFIPPLQHNFRNYSSLANYNMRLDPWFVTGITDGEGCFGLYIYKNAKLKIGWYTILEYKMTLHERDQDLLQMVGEYFTKKHVVYKHGQTTKQIQIRSIEDIKFLISHFNKFPLLTQKYKDYELFKKAYTIIVNKEHLTIEGIHKLISIKSSMNLGLSDELLKAFPNIEPQTIKTCHSKIESPQWISGFTSGEGSFQVYLKKSQTIKVGYQVMLRFSIGQQARDKQLMGDFINYFNCGTLAKKFNKKYNNYHYEYQVNKFSDVKNIIIPFFNKYPIVGVKLLDFQDFCKIVKIIEQNGHLTDSGLNEIREIKQGMNKNRKKFF